MTRVCPSAAAVPGPSPADGCAADRREIALARLRDGTHSSCQPSWGGITPLSSSLIQSEVSSVRAAGGDVIVSFGGAQGPDLSHVCTSVQSLTDAYKQAVKTYDAQRVDFDLEGNALENAAGSEREILAIGQLEQWANSQRRPLQVSLTVPVDPTGLESDVTRVLNIARTHNVRLDIVNVMAMDFGNSLAPASQKTMGDYAIEAATAAEKQVASILPGSTFANIGLIVMIGINDLPDEIFTLSDTRAVTAFASTNGLGRVAMWSVARDRACGTVTTTTRDTCSGVAQAPYAFSRAFGA